MDVNVPSFLLANLATADSLMSIYLLFIVVKDSTSRSNFGKAKIFLIWSAVWNLVVINFYFYF